MTRTLLIALLTTLAGGAQAQSLFLDDARVYLDGETVTRDVVVEDGRLIDVAERLRAPDGARSLSGAWVTPGLFAADSRVGLVEIGAESDTNDLGADTSLSSVANRAADAFNPRSVHVPIVRRQGITHALVLPNPQGHTIFGGTAAIVNLSGDFNSVLDETGAIHVALGERGADLAGGSRSAAMSQLRGALRDAIDGVDGREDGNVLTPLDAQGLRAALRGDLPLAVRASRASDIVALVNLQRDYPGLDIIVYGAEEAYLVIDEVEGSGLHFVVDPMNNLPDSFESAGARFGTFKALVEAGVDVAIANTSSLGVTRAQALRQHAGNAVARGADWADAFEAISSTPAGWFGVDDLGLVVWDGDPLEVTSAPVHMILNDEAMSLESRQTRLRDRYNPAREDDRPYKYR